MENPLTPTDPGLETAQAANRPAGRGTGAATSSPAGGQSKAAPATALRAGASSSTRGQRARRTIVSILLLLAWLAAAAIGGPYFGRVGEVASNSQAAFLPSSAEATQVQERLSEFRSSEAIPAIVVFTSGSPIGKAEQGALFEAIGKAAQTEGVAEGFSPALVSQDGLAAQAFMGVKSDADVKDTVTELLSSLQQHVPDGFTVYVTGPAGFTADLVTAFGGIDGILLIVALIAVLVILVLVYRSALLPIAVLATSLFALCAALLTVWWLAKWEVLLLNGQTQGILFILVIGAATDYSLLYVSRFREELRVTRDRGAATRAALRGSFEPILASGGTVIAGLMCLLLSDLKSNAALGPVASIGIAFAMLAALTMLPAALFLLGRVSFWPNPPRFEPEVVASEGGLPSRGLWARLSKWVQRKPRTIWIVTTVVLLIGAIGVPQLKVGGVPQSELVLGTSQARDGQVALGKHFPGGSGSPLQIIVPADGLETAVKWLSVDSNVDGLSIASAASPAGSAPITPEGIVPLGPPGTPPVSPTVSGGDVLLQATLVYSADSDEAGKAVQGLRSMLHREVPGSMIGGVTAIAVDTTAASIHDRNLILPVVLLVIMLILMLLLRSVIAPVLLIATTVLSFATAMGVSALIFNHVLAFPGADASVPLFGFVFLVALGIDYNIFLMARVREETLAHGTYAGITRGLAITGGVITSAGLVLAATFAALFVIPILFLAQLAFIVAFGVLLDTFVVRTLLVPALGLDIGPKIWWPSKLADQPRLELADVAAGAAQITASVREAAGAEAAGAVAAGGGAGRNGGGAGRTGTGAEG
ncbi:MAG: MMPL family transporter [Buchananella hordeovulneris]|nr:MMPL family transporter [Buchananella hordeovulneris]